MVWGRFDDSMPHHPKAIAAGPDAFALWIAATLYCNRFHTDGVVKKALLGAVYPSPEFTANRQKKAAQRLVDVDAWSDEGDAWRIHDYEDHQSEALKEGAEDKKSYERERKRLQRAAKKAQRAADIEKLSRYVPDIVPDTRPGQKADIVPDSPRAPTPAGPSAPARGPTRPDPTVTPTEGSGASLSDMVSAFREITGREDFKHEPWTGTEVHALREMRGTCGDVATFRAKLRAIVGGDGDFACRQRLTWWMDAVKTPTEVPAEHAPGGADDFARRMREEVTCDR